MHLKILILATLFIANAWGSSYMNFAEDRAIARSLLQQFKESCPHTYNQDRILIEQLQIKLDEARKDKVAGAETCIQQQFSQMTGVHFLYKRICDELTFTGIPEGQTEVNRLLVSSHKYRRGLRPYVSGLNDCLREKKAPLGYFFETEANQGGNSQIYKSLESLKMSPPFRPNRIEFR